MSEEVQEVTSPNNNENTMTEERNHEIENNNNENENENNNKNNSDDEWHSGGEEKEDEESESPNNHHQNNNNEQKEVNFEPVVGNDVKNIILQVLSPYLDDDGGNDAPVAPVDDNNNNNENNKNNNNALVEDTAPRYDHAQVKGWIQLITDLTMEKLLAMKKPFKYVVHIVIMRKCGAGMHVCSSCYYGQQDGHVGHSHDLSPHLYAVVTVYWCSI